MAKIPAVIHQSWHSIIEPALEGAEILKLRDLVLPKSKYHPDKDKIFNVFSMPLDDIKVVILGQDPYPTPNDAIGFAFAISNDTNTRKPVSFRNIEKEVGHSLDRELKSWRDQGVFLLNTALTVESKRAGSHLSYWKDFSKRVISQISKQVNPVWFLWGLHAQSYKDIINNNSVENYGNILISAHPAAEAYSGGKAGFFGCGHFHKANELLELKRKTIINW